MMATIGMFTKAEDGSFTGSISTLKLDLNGVRIMPIKEPKRNGPTHRVYHKRAEIGAAWPKQAEESGLEYLSITIDDPSLPAPLYTALFKVEEVDDDSHQLVWNRPQTSDN
jgi:uncharacterized protein (DUF736 family)